MNEISPNDEADISAEIRARFKAVFEIKSAALSAPLGSAPLNLDERGLQWNVLLMAISEILPHCRGFTADTRPEYSLYTLGLWDYLNGREISIGVNHRGGYDLTINAEEIHWVETQLPLDLLLLKLLVLDCIPVELRAMSN